jgi:micrococcal nuclease
MLYHYDAIVNRVIDGDTVNLTIDLGFRMYHRANCRLYGINTPELNAKDPDTRLKAQEAMKFLSEWLLPGIKVSIISKELDKYGRPLVNIFVGDVKINDMLVAKQLAVKYME